MMQIKFRAYIKTLQWLVPVQGICFDCETVEVDLTDGNGDFAEYGFDEVELMMFSGLEDRNGVEVFKGDICQRKYMKNDIEVVELYEVVFDVGAFYCEKIGARGLSSSLGYYCTNVKTIIEVIGNKYDNPELSGGS